MMASNFLSRFRTSATDPAAASIYETIQQHDEDSQESDVEDRAAIAADRRNIDEDLPVFDDVDIGSSPESDRHRREGVTRGSSPLAVRKENRARWMQSGRGLVDVEELDDDVPASLLIEGADIQPLAASGSDRSARQHGRSPEQEREEQWRRTQAIQDLHAVPPNSNNAPSPGISSDFRLRALANRRDKALWRWMQVEDVDRYLFRAYFYYLNHGFWSIMLKRLLNLATSAFVIGFTLFLTQCIDYSRFRGATKLSDIKIAHCTRDMGFMPNVLLWLSTFFWIFKVIQYVMDIPGLQGMHDFYLHLLDIPEDEIQSISWQEIVSRLMALRDSNPNIVTSTNMQNPRFKHLQNKQRMDAQDIANRLMRRDNYMVAMINKDILDMTLPVPGLRNRQLFTRTLEWNLNLCIMDYIFGPTNQVRAIFLKDTHRKALSEGLKRRFKFMGIVTVICAPFLVTYFIVQMFFRYFNEYQKDPAQIGRREYNVLARWKFREFNELHHLFERRLNMSHPFATRYLNQFPKDKTIQVARFVTFVSGAIVGVLGLATVFDQENFLSFEITSGRTAIFYIGVFGTIWAVSRGMLPDEHMVYDSSYSIEEVIDFTHYRPAHWERRLHTVEVKKEFEQLYQMQIFIFAEELLSMLFTPFVLWFSLPKCSDQIIDFFREFTVHVDGVGYVCSFAEFNFNKPGNTRATETALRLPTTAVLRDEYFSAKDQKLEQSYWGFMNDYARNPRADIRFSYQDPASGKRKFNLPPPFPGLPSPAMRAEPSRVRETVGIRDTGSRQNRVLSPEKRASDYDGATPFQSLLLDARHQPTHVSGLGHGLDPLSPQALRPRPMSKKAGKQSSRHGAHLSRLQRQESTISELPDSDINPDEPPADLTSPQRHDPDVGLVSPSTVSPTRANMAQDGGDQANPREADGTQSAGASATVSKSREGMGSWKYPEDELDKSNTDEEDDIEDITNENAGILGLVRQLKRVQRQQGS